VTAAFEQSTNTERMRRPYFDNYVAAVNGAQESFESTVGANRPLFTADRRSEIDQVVEQLPSPEQTGEVLTVLARLPSGDEHQLHEAAGLFERLEADNALAAGDWIDTDRKRSNTTTTRH
jgi:hypothetical protein